MIIDFSCTNFRSFKDKAEFTMKADALKSKVDNTFEADLVLGNSVSLLKTAVVYGANASGKSNFIKAFLAFTWLIKNSHKFELDKPKINCYEPFELDVNTQKFPVNFKISFIIDHIKYDYEVSFDAKVVVHEKLDFSPKGQISNMFERKLTETQDYDVIQLGKNLTDKRIPKKVFKNQLYLSKFGIDIPHQQLTPVFRYLSNINVWNAYDKFSISELANEISVLISQKENENLKNRLSKLIRISDTKIESIASKELKREDFRLPNVIPDEIANEFFENNKVKTFSYHKLFDGKKEVGIKEFDFNKKASTGTKVLFALGGKILQTLDSGGVIVFDELDNSLHPKLCKFLVRLFNSKISNPRNAQLIFATHEVTLLDKDVFRKDQIWFAQKNNFGSSEMYCANEFEGLRDDTNFELWYRSGKFGGNPKIKEIEFIYE
ncbi:AAA family ATPase [Flavobacterium humidisoli]|uniref:ATP-binding protein n=1 Tax=Flavobacterium humidisoli TaxID=2937442 RepID=A0ABY4LY23_9FLAO|nr:ATP-binding protein [Flavobacterium humidisoli]UPZ17976.1 ATP-binding protein [Flavobacterium humidisoli]